MEETNPSSMYINNTDLLEELFIRLPLKSLGRFKSVSKEWKSILESKWFVERHLSLQKPGRKISTAYNCDCGVTSSLLSESRLEEGEEFLSLHCDATRPWMSCDGLVCITEAEWVNVLNPSTGQLWRFHYPSLMKLGTISRFTNVYFRGYCMMGFGRDNVKGSYKVVRIFSAPNYSDILDVNTGEWHKLWQPCLYKVDVRRKSASVNGSIYWLRMTGHDDYSILALDLHTEEFHYVQCPPLPKGMIMFEAQIVNIGDRLTIATPERNDFLELELGIWTMFTETWSKTHSISLASLGITPYLESRFFTLVTLSNQGDIVFYDDKKRLFKYYQEKDQLRTLSSDIFVICPYLENLVPFQTQQVEFKTGITCIRRTRNGIHSRRVKEFLRKGKDLGVWLWKNEIKSLAIYLNMTYCFGTPGDVFRAAMILLLCLLAPSGYLLVIILILVLLRIFALTMYETNGMGLYVALEKRRKL